MHALIVDDEKQMTQIVGFALATEGFTSHEFHRGIDAWNAVQERSYDLAVIDLMLPDISGITLCQRIRDRSDTPIILLTALGEVEHRLRGLEAGADDYLAKPFSPQELVLRARAIVRRSHRHIEPQAEQIVNHRMREDIASGQVFIDGIHVDMSDIERRLLRLLMSHPGEVFSVRDILNSVWGHYAAPGGYSLVKTTVYRLRKRLDKAGIDPDLIRSVRSRGYTALPQ